MEAISFPQGFSAVTVRHLQLSIDFLKKEECAKLIANHEQTYRISINKRVN